MNVDRSGFMHFFLVICCCKVVVYIENANCNDFGMLNMLFPSKVSLGCYHISILKGLGVQVVAFTWYLQ
jgi:hypothetical protein